MTAKEAIRKLAPLIAKTTGYRMSEEWINFLTTWMDTGLELYEDAAESVKTGKAMSRKGLILLFVDRLNSMGALTFDAMNAETAKCVTSLIGTGVSVPSCLGLTVSEVGIPLAMIEVTSLIIDVLSMIKDCEEPATNLRDKIFDTYDQWLDSTSRTWAVEFNNMLYSTMGPQDAAVISPF